MKHLRALPRHLARAVIYLAAASMASWSLYVVAHDMYGVPRPLAVIVAAVFDGAALACLNLASDAVDESRSAAGPRTATLALATVSIYLNVSHARYIGGGFGAALLFASPTVALLLISDLSWAATRARVRAARGERPMTLPVFGTWGWLLAHRQAWQATVDKAAAHVTGQTSTPKEPGPGRTATAALREHFAALDPADAVRIAHDAQPALPPAELASLLVTYGVTVDAVQVALVLHQRRPVVEIDRDTDDADPDAPQVGGRPELTKAEAILDAASALGPGAKAADVVARVARIHRITTDDAYVRTVLSRAKKNTRPHDGIGQGGGGYA
ncbi:hypothetical protein ACIOC1_00300 [Streptomyces sp. NPDC088197]|uniref:hypothetical protein n=1 Tax=Streptomyces sp. NPDC088197 TaxID=3365840 RepID=UPI0038090BE4